LLLHLTAIALVCTVAAIDESAQNCLLNSAWCTQVPEIIVESEAEWGSLRPGTYFGLKQKVSGPVLGTGIMWSSSLASGNPLRDQTNHGELTRFEWLRHDGKHFGTESLVDGDYEMLIEADFVIPDSERGYRNSTAGLVPEWFQKVVIRDSPHEGNRTADAKKSFVFYFGTECVDGDTAACLADAKSQGWKVVTHEGSPERGYDAAVSIIGYTESTGWFCLFLVVDQLPNARDAREQSHDAPSVSFTGIGGVNLLHGADRIKKEAKLMGAAAEEPSSAGTRKARKQPLRASLFDDFGDLNNEADPGASFVAVHVGFNGHMRVDALLYSHLNVTSHEELLGYIGLAERERKVNVLPVWLCTELQVSYRSLVKVPVPTGTSTAPSTVMVETTGNTVDQQPSGSSRDLTRTSTAPGEFSVAEQSKGGPLMTAYCANRGECIREEVDKLLLKYVMAFDERFAAAFPLDTVGSADDADSPVFTRVDVETAKVCLSSLLGGMGYFQGRPDVGAAADIQFESAERAMSEAARSSHAVKVNPQSAPLALLSATPSRTAFPRGFLWDEGFHQMLISRWDPLLSMEVISSWLNAMHFPCNTLHGAHASDSSCVGGWIPREMILGEEARRRVPDEFVVQRVNIANPPTFLLVVENLLTRFESVEPPRRYSAPQPTPKPMLPAKTGEVATFSEDLRTDDVHGDKEVMRRYRKTLDPADEQLVHLEHSEHRDAVLSFLRDIYPRLHRWVQWFLHSQKGSSAHPGSFRWRGRSASDGKVIPNTLASGLDDYPRAPVPSAEEHHVDLHCWMVKATAVMARLETVLRNTGYALPPHSEALALMAQYQSQHEYLLQRLDELHWSDQHHGFFDVGLNDEDGHFLQEMVFRCSNPQDQSFKDIAVSMDVIRQRRQDFCPTSHPKPLYPIGDGQGNYKMVERLVTEKPKLSHIPRVGYVTIFPLLLRLLDPYSPKLGALLDVVEDPQQLWTDHGLRSLAQTDKYYQRRNSPGDAPYWRYARFECVVLFS
jgi:hypothetical protein